MPDFPGFLQVPMALLSTYDKAHGGAWGLGGMSSGGVWPAANRAIYVSVLVENPVVVTQMAVWVTVQSGNLDVGIYSETGTRLVSAGSTVVGAAAAIQAINIADTLLAPGVYFLAMCVDNTTAAFQRTAAGNAGIYSSFGVQQQAVGAVTLPATATFATPASAYAPAVIATVMSAVI